MPNMQVPSGSVAMNLTTPILHPSGGCDEKEYPEGADMTALDERFFRSSGAAGLFPFRKIKRVSREAAVDAVKPGRIKWI